jgi:hypothetical protein
MFPPKTFFNGKGNRKPFQAVVDLLKANEQLRVTATK